MWYWVIIVAVTAQLFGVAAAQTVFEPGGTAATRTMSSVAEIQRALDAAGFDPGPVDGIMGARTRQAMAAFARSAGLNEDEVGTPVFYEALRAAGRASDRDPTQTANAAGITSPGSYCFATANARLRLDVGDDAAHFSFFSSQGDGYSCSMEGEAEPFDDGSARGWIHVDEMTGMLCELVLIADAGSVTLSDPTSNCRRVWCGMRGEIEGERFDGSQRVAC